MSLPNSLMIDASTAGPSFSLRQRGDSTARALEPSPSTTSARARMIVPSAVSGPVVPNACTTVRGDGLPRNKAISLRRRSASIPGQPGSIWAVAAISPLGTPVVSLKGNRPGKDIPVEGALGQAVAHRAGEGSILGLERIHAAFQHRDIPGPGGILMNVRTWMGQNRPRYFRTDIAADCSRWPRLRDRCVRQLPGLPQGDGGHAHEKGARKCNTGQRPGWH